MTTVSSAKRGRGRPPETWKHEIYALILTTLSPGQDPATMEANFVDRLDRILHGDPPAQAGAGVPDAAFDATLERGVVDEARRNGAASATVARLQEAVDDVELNRSSALRLLRRLLKLRSLQTIRWTTAERALWVDSLGYGPAPSRNEPRQRCTCRPCRAAAALPALALATGIAALGKKAWSPRCKRGGPGLSMWERGAWKVAWELLGADYAPWTFKVMVEKARGYE